MGVMRFVIEPPEVLEQCPDIVRAYISGLDGRVFPTRIEIEDGVMSCRRQVSDSGNLNVTWPVEGFGRPVLRTSSLPEREESFLLPLELARGKISQVRDQLSAWEGQGMRVPEEFAAFHKDAHRLFGKAIATQHSDRTKSGELAQQALVNACHAARLISQAYTQQRLEFRRRRSARLPALLGCSLGQAVPKPAWSETFPDAFTAALVPIEWKTVEPSEGEYDWDVADAQIDWCEKNKLLMYGGPLIDLAPDGMPKWLWQWEHDFLNLQSFVCDFVETAITRYFGRIRTWEVSMRANTGGVLAMSEENRLSLVAKTLEVARHVDQDIQLMVGIDQPWGEYQARGHHRLSPLQFVDALLRSGVGLSGVNLEFAIGYHPCGTAPRDLLDFSRLIDRWSYLGIPLYVTAAFPSSSDDDPLAQGDLEVHNIDGDSVAWTETAQIEWVEKCLPVLMAKQSVVGIFWSHFTDSAPHRFPNAGMLRADDSRKPVLERVTDYRRTYWSAGDHG